MLRSKHPFFLLYMAMATIFLVLLIGTLGYIVIEGYSPFDALYMCVITVASVGFMEVHPLTNPGRLFTIFLILANFAIIGFIVATLSRYFLDGEFIKRYKLFNMQHKIDELKGHVIICGFGRNGTEAALRLAKSNKEVVIIEKNLNGRDMKDIPYYIEADATKDETLLAAGIQNASALICTLPDDAENVFIVLTARELNKHINIISRATKDSSVSKLKTAGADNVIMPDKIGGSHMATLLLSPDIKEFLDLLGSENSDQFSVAELKVGRDMALSATNWQQTGATVLGIKENNHYHLNPDPSTLLNSSCKVIAMGAKKQLEALQERL